MTDYTKLVKALRCCCPQPEETCDGCPYDTAGECNISRMMFDAAAAIEALQAEVDTLKRVDYKRCQECLYLGQPVGEEFVPKHGEWELIDEAEPMRWGCSRCKYLSWETSSYCPRCGAKMEVQE